MLNQAAAVALRLLLFRAGPQDFPYSVALTRLTVPLLVIAAFLQYRLTLPEGQAAVHALVSVAVLAAFTHLMLRARGLLSRFHQTLGSLFAIDTLMTCLLVAPLSAIAPQMLRLAQNPDLARTEPVPALPALAVMVLSFWNFLVTAHIYRHALNTHFGVGALLALAAAIVTVSLASAISALAT